MIILSREQIKIIANFCNDIAKGIFLSTVINLALSADNVFMVRILVSIFGLILSSIFLSLAVYYSKNNSNLL
jgi:hypothetical protein